MGTAMNFTSILSGHRPLHLALVVLFIWQIVQIDMLNNEVTYLHCRVRRGNLGYNFSVYKNKFHNINHLKLAVTWRAQQPDSLSSKFSKNKYFELKKFMGLLPQLETLAPFGCSSVTHNR